MSRDMWLTHAPWYKYSNTIKVYGSENIETYSTATYEALQKRLETQSETIQYVLIHRRRDFQSPEAFEWGGHVMKVMQSLGWTISNDAYEEYRYNPMDRYALFYPGVDEPVYHKFPAPLYYKLQPPEPKYKNAMKRV